MPSAESAFYVQGLTQMVALTTVAITPIQATTVAGVQGLMLGNLSTNNVFCTIAASSVTTPVLATTTGPVVGFFLHPSGAVTFSSPPNPWVSGMTTGAALTALLAITPGYGL